MLDKINAATDDLTIDPTPAAMVLFNPVFDNGPNGYHGVPSNIAETGFQCYCKEYKNPFGKWAALFKARYSDLSPIHNISSKTPPTLVMLGSEDNLIPVETPQKFQKEMNLKGNRCDLIIYDGAGHGFFNGVRSVDKSTNPERFRYFFETLQATDNFLQDLGFLKGEANVKEYFKH